MPRIRFLQDRTTEEAKPQHFKKDQVLDLPDDEAGHASANHWINRGVAELVEPAEGASPMRSGRGERGERSEVHGEHPEGLPARSGGFTGPVKGTEPPVNPAVIEPAKKPK